MLSINFFFFLLLFQATGLFCEYDPLCGTLVAVIKFFFVFLINCLSTRSCVFAKSEILNVLSLQDDVFV